MGIFSPNLRVAGKTIAPGTNSASSYTENVVILPANAYVISFFGRVKTAFTGLTKPKVSLGVTGDTDKYMVAQPIDAINELLAGVPPASNKATLGVKPYCASMPKEKISTTGRTVIATFTSDSTLFSPTVGEVEFVVVYVDVN